MKESLDFGKAADQIGAMFTIAYWIGSSLATRPELVIAGCLLYLCLDRFSRKLQEE